MDSNSLWRPNHLGGSQNQQQGAAIYSSGGQFRGFTSDNHISGESHTDQGTMSYNNHQHNGFQQDGVKPTGIPASFNSALPSTASPHFSPERHPPINSSPYISSQSHPVQGTLTSSNFSNPRFSSPAPPSSSSSAFPSPPSTSSFVQPPINPQSNLHAHSYPPPPSLPDRTLPPMMSLGINGPHQGNRAFVSSSCSSTGSAPGSHQASRSDTPLANNACFENAGGQSQGIQPSWNNLLPLQPPYSSSSFVPHPHLQAQAPPPGVPDQSNLVASQLSRPHHQVQTAQQPWQQLPSQPPMHLSPKSQPWQPQQQHLPQQQTWSQHPTPQQHWSQNPPQQQQQQQPWSQHPPQQQPWQHFSQSHQNAAYQGLSSGIDRLSLNQGQRLCNLMQEKDLVSKEGFVLSEPRLNQELRATNCSSDIMCCTLNAIPNTPSLLKKTRLPMGLLLHPFKDLNQLPLVMSSVIVRCRSCRTYINSFVVFVDPGRWNCNVCGKVNDVPGDFSYDPTTKTYGEPHRRPEVRSSTIEYIAPAEYLVRPPMPAVYLCLLDVSYNAITTGYLKLFCETLIEELDKLPGDGRKQIGFLAYDSHLYFFNLSEELAQPQMLIIPDLDEPTQPCPDGMLVNLHQSKRIVTDLLQKLPSMFQNNLEVGSALGSALEVATKMMATTGGRISVFQTLLPEVGQGSLKKREESNERVTKNINCLGPATDFYKKIALECSGDHVAIDLFLFNSQYCDVATIGGAARHTGGCLHYFPGFHAPSNRAEVKRFKSVFSRYLTRKIGFEAVMRIRCTKGVSIQSYHGNFFVRSTDLLSLPNINPDAGYAVQLNLDDELRTNYVCFQTALLYTSSKAERRIRVHTLCVPVASVQSDVESSANQLAIVGLLSKMAVDKSLNFGLGDSREALVNAAVDIFTAFGATLSPGQRMPNQILAPPSLKLVPLFVLALLKSVAFRIGVPTKIDDRIVAMEMCKNMPLKHLLLHIYPHLYPIHNLDVQTLTALPDQKKVVLPPIVSLSLTQLDRHGAYLMDAGSYIYFYLNPAISDIFCNNVLDVQSFTHSVEGEIELPQLDNSLSVYLRDLVRQLNSERPFFAPLILIREDGKLRHLFYQHLVEDKTESSFSHQEFLHHVLKEMKL